MRLEIGFPQGLCQLKLEIGTLFSNNLGQNPVYYRLSN